MIEPPWCEPLGPEIWASPHCYISVNCRWEYRMNTVCEIPNCPAITELGARFCRLHRLARQAIALGLTGTATGGGAKQCLLCGCNFKPHDWVLTQTTRRDPTVVTTTGRPLKGSPIGHVHVTCAPRIRKVTRRQLRKSMKPLFADL